MYLNKRQGGPLALLTAICMELVVKDNYDLSLYVNDAVVLQCKKKLTKKPPSQLIYDRFL